MQPNEELVALMHKIEEENAGQEKYARLQFIMSAAGALCAVAALLLAFWCAVTVVPKAVTTLNQVNTVLAQAETELTGLQEITDQLGEALPEMIDNTNKLVVGAQNELGDAAAKLNNIDIDGLNKAIGDLQAVVKPLAKLFGR